MKNLIPAALLGVVMLAALLLSIRSPITAESLFGYGTVLALVGVAALEYRVDWKRIFGRS